MYANHSQTGLPPGPDLDTATLVDIFSADPFPFLDQCCATYGEVFTLALGDFGVTEHKASGQWVFFTRADDVKQLLKAGSSVQMAGRANQIQFQKILPDQSSLMLDGALHQARRKILAKVLQGEQKIRQFTAAIIQATLGEIGQFPPDRPFALTPCFRRIAAHTMRRLTFGNLADPAIERVTDHVYRFGDPQGPAEQKKPLIDQGVATMGEWLHTCPHAMASEQEATLSAALIRAWKEDGSLTMADVQAELMTVMLAGVDTTAATLSWCAAQILSRPVVLAQVQEELKRVLGAQQITSVSTALFDQMPKLDAVIYETTRLCPLFFTTTPRLLVDSLSIAGYELPPGTLVASYMNGIHLRADYYPDPQSFRPERFIEAKADPYRYLFFGGGIRRCPGMNFALYEIKLVLATLLHTCRLEPVEVNTLRERHGSFFAPKGGIQVCLA